jgi:hypothetical protein
MSELLTYYPIPGFPDYEISPEGVVKNKVTNTFVRKYRGIDFEYVDCVFLWRDGNRQCMAVTKLLEWAEEAKNSRS